MLFFSSAKVSSVLEHMNFVFSNSSYLEFLINVSAYLSVTIAASSPVPRGSLFSAGVQSESTYNFS